MTRVYFQAGRLRLKVIAVQAVILALFGVVNISAYDTLFEMSEHELQWQKLVLAVLLAAVFAVLALYSWFSLAPVARLLAELREHGVAATSDENRAQRAALRFPLTFAVVALVVSSLALALGLAVDVTMSGMELDFAVGLAFATATELLVTCALIYLIFRTMLRPVVAHFRHEQVPSGFRFSIRSKVAFATVSLCLAVSVPTALISSVRLKTLQQNDHARHREHLARAVAMGADLLSPGALQQNIASIHLTGDGRIRFRETPAPTAVKVRPPEHAPRSIYLEVISTPTPTHPHTHLVVLVALLLGLAVLVGRHLGQNLSHDVELVSSRIRQLADALGQSEGEQLRPLIAELPQYSDLRRLADALNELLERIVKISITHFLAIEKTLEADRVKTQFLANVSHDLRSPLNSVIGFSQLLVRDADQLNTRQRHDLELINRCGNELLLLINHVLDSAKLDAGRLTLHREDSLPAELLSHALKETQRRGVPDGVQIDTELQAGMQAVTVDPQRLTQAMVCIIGHCVGTVAETGHKGRVVTQLRLEKRPVGPDRQRFLVFRVATTVGGLPEQEVQRLFHGFRRRSGRRGLGLDLPLARSLLELHDGTLEVSSSVGMGTTFTASVPLLQPKVLARLRPRKNPQT